MLRGWTILVWQVRKAFCCRDLSHVSYVGSIWSVDFQTRRFSIRFALRILGDVYSFTGYGYFLPDQISVSIQSCLGHIAFVAYV